MTDMTRFIEGMPKAELHVHLEGTLEPELKFDLARRNGIELPYQSVEEMRAAYDFDDLPSFLRVYYEGMSVLLTEHDFHDLTNAHPWRWPRCWIDGRASATPGVRGRRPMGRHQTGRARPQSVANSVEAMTAARTPHDDECNLPSQIGVRGSSAGEANHADPVFHPIMARLTETRLR